MLKEVIERLKALSMWLLVGMLLIGSSGLGVAKETANIKIGSASRIGAYPGYFINKGSSSFHVDFRMEPAGLAIR